MFIPKPTLGKSESSTGFFGSFKNTLSSAFETVFEKDSKVHFDNNDSKPRVLSTAHCETNKTKQMKPMSAIEHHFTTSSPNHMGECSIESVPAYSLSLDEPNLSEFELVQLQVRSHCMTY